MADSTVLVVDDEPDVTQTFRNVLEPEYAVETVQTGAAALETLSEHIDVVLLDRRMPEITGDQVLATIRDRGLDCRVVIVTAVDPDLDIIGMDFDEYLVKPVTGDQLQETVDQMLTRQSLDSQIERMVQVASKLATLEAKLELSQLESSERYNSLRSEYDSLRDEISLPDKSDDPYVNAKIEKLEALLKQRRR